MSRFQAGFVSSARPPAHFSTEGQAPLVISLTATSMVRSLAALALALWSAAPIHGPSPAAPPDAPLAPDAVYDCNENGVEDAVDIAIGTSGDTNENGVPDECESRAK